MCGYLSPKIHTKFPDCVLQSVDEVIPMSQVIEVIHRYEIPDFPPTELLEEDGEPLETNAEDATQRAETAEAELARLKEELVRIKRKT